MLALSGVPTLQQSTLGLRGEDLACRELRRLGHEILARRYRTRHGEIDIVTRDREALVFVEVKARVSHRFGSPLAAVTRAKQPKLTLMALDYLSQYRSTGVAYRFDVVGILVGEGRPSIELVRDAFGTSG